MKKFGLCSSSELCKQLAPKFCVCVKTEQFSFQALFFQIKLQVSAAESSWSGVGVVGVAALLVEA